VRLAAAFQNINDPNGPMIKLLEVRPLTGYKLRLRFADGTEGEVDLSKSAGRAVFEVWEDRSAFEGVHIGKFGQVAWSDELEMCADALYLRLTDKKPEEVFPNLSEMVVDA
jgi:hypothetical protein